jgi:ankyrin repeat protein
VARRPAVAPTAAAHTAGAGATDAAPARPDPGPVSQVGRRRLLQRASTRLAAVAGLVLGWRGTSLAQPTPAGAGALGARPAPASAADAALIQAAAHGDTVTVRRHLADGAGVTATDAQGRTALVAATYGNHADAARLLIAAGADVNAQDAIRNSAFLLAGARGHLAILRLTLAAGADLASTNRYGGTALIPACHYGHVETVRELLKTAIAVDHVNDLGWTALLEAVILGDGGPAHVEIVRMLLARGARPSLADRDGVTPLAHARARGQAELVRLLLAAGAR